MQVVLELLGEDQPRKLGCFTGVMILPGKSKEIVGIWGEEERNGEKSVLKVSNYNMGDRGGNLRE